MPNKKCHIYIYNVQYIQLYKLCRRQEEVEIEGTIERVLYVDKDHFQTSLLTFFFKNLIKLLTPKSSENRRFSERIELDKFT